MTLSALVPSVRRLVNDLEKDYRWPDETICGYLRDSVIRLNNARPESRYLNKRLTDIVFPSDVGTFVLPAEYDRWHQGFIYYAAARCLEEDAADTANKDLANDFMAKAEARFAA